MILALFWDVLVGILCEYYPLYLQAFFFFLLIKLKKKSIYCMCSVNLFVIY